jgi:DivIVA domain-containing protein
MPLTPAEVHNVAFKKPPIGKRGYDEEEVDAFLDIVEVELARLIEENNDLRARGDGGSGPVETVIAGVDPDAHAAVQSQVVNLRDENARLRDQVNELQRTASAGSDGAQKQVVALQQQLTVAEQSLGQARKDLTVAQQAASAAEARAAQARAAAATAAASDGPATTQEYHVQAAQVLALAQQTADNLVSQHKAEAERVLREAQASSQSQLSEAQARANAQFAEAENRAKQLVTDSQERAAKTVNDAEQRAAAITAQFEQRKAALERRVEELRVYEREYRTRLRSYLESQLRELDASGRSDAGEAQVGGQG